MEHVWSNKGGYHTRIAFPIEVVFGIAMAFQVQSRLFPCRAMCEGHMVVCDVVEEVDLLFLQ